MVGLEGEAGAVGRRELQGKQVNEVVRLERRARAAFRMDFQDQQERSTGVRLEGKAGASIRMELQGQKDAEATVASGACVGSDESVPKWPELPEWLEWPDEL